MKNINAMKHKLTSAFIDNSKKKTKNISYINHYF